MSTHDPAHRKTVDVLDSKMAYVDAGTGDPVVFLHGNPTFSFLWRNILPTVSEFSRCLAPDLIGMGHSGKLAGGEYRFVDHARYLDAWFESLGLNERVTLVVHDWGSALGFDWAARHPDAVKSIVYMEALVMPMSSDQWPAAMLPLFQALRSPAGEEMIIQNNVFVEGLLPGAINRGLTAEEHDAYRAPYTAGGETRRPTLAWPREIPFDGSPPDVAKTIESYGNWLETSQVPKLFINAEPGAILTGDQREYCRTWPNQKEVTVAGTHYIQEDSANDIAVSIVKFLDDIGQ